MPGKLILSTLACAVLSACAQGSVVSGPAQPVAAPEPVGIAHPDIWPQYRYPVVTPAEEEERVEKLLGSMTLEE